MPASRLSRSIITRRCTALIFCANRNQANRAKQKQSQENETGRRLYRRLRGGDLGPCVRREPDRTRRIFTGADDHAALCHRSAAVLVRAQAQSLLAGADRDQLYAVSRPV